MLARLIVLTALFGLAGAAPAAAVQSDTQETTQGESGGGKLELWGIEFEVGPCTGSLGQWADVKVPEGLLFTGRKGTVDYLTRGQNPTGESEIGMVLATESDWFVIFSYEESGHVELDADALLKTLQEANEYGNEIRKERGWSRLDLVGWHKPPFYDEKTNNLTWATIVRSEHGQAINWSTKLLGRTGTMNVDLVVGLEDIEAAMPAFDDLLAGYAYRDGHKYAQFKPGDKVAEYGLTALVAGGAGVVAFKTGLFAVLGKWAGKLWFVIVAAVAAVFAWVKRTFGFGNKESSENPGS
jgi:uncharacterized membrane-anchored protein